MRQNSSSWLDHYKTKPLNVLAARVTKRNINKALLLIQQHMSVVSESIEIQHQTEDTQPAVRFRHWYDSEDKITEVTLGSYIVTQHSRILVLTPREFADKYRRHYSFPSYYTPTIDEVTIIRKLNPDAECCYGYDWICSETGMSKERAKKRSTISAAWEWSSSGTDS